MLLLLAIYEDTGLLPRIAFMMDGILHRVGLHGKSVVPIILGYGCNVPAIMSTRNLENPRDRLVTMLLVPFVACSARTVVILAIAGKFLGATRTLSVYLGNLAVVLAVSSLLTRFSKSLAPGIIMEMPPLRRPYPIIVMKKVWLRPYEFPVFAWPVLIVANVALAALSAAGIDDVINRLFSPLTSGLLRLPEQTGITLFLGVFRKELTILMLGSALGTDNFAAALSQPQMLTLVIFTVLYIPCVAALTAIWKEGGWKVAVCSAALNLAVAVLLAGAAAQVMRLF